MSGLLYADGFLPIRITDKAIRGSTQEYEAVTVWDGSTYSGASPGLPSKYSGESFPVVGYGTFYPFGLDLETAVKLYMRPKILRFTLGGVDAFSAAGGGSTSGSFPSATVYQECDASQEPDSEAPLWARVQKQGDLVTGPIPRFANQNPEGEPFAWALSEFINEVAEGGVRGTASADILSVYSESVIYKVGSLYYPPLELTWSLSLLAYRYADPEVEGDEGGTATLDVGSYRRVVLNPGDSEVAIPCTLFGEDFGLTLRCVTSSGTTGTGAGVTGTAADVTIDIGVPASSAGWLDYGGIYDENTGARV